MKPHHTHPSSITVASDRFARLTAVVAAAARDGERRLKACRAARGRRHVHALRVTARRLQACLRLASAVVPDEICRNARRALDDVLAALGRFRDATVQRQLGRELCAGFADYGELDRRLARREQRERTAAIAALKRAKLHGPMRAVVAALRRRAGTTDSERRLNAGLRAALRRDWERMAARWPRAMGEEAAFHRARVALKRYRYELEALPEVLGRKRPFGTAALRLRQRQLGELHDDELLLARVTKWVARGQLPPALRHALQPLVLRRAARLRRACLVGPPAFVSTGRM